MKCPQESGNVADLVVGYAARTLDPVRQVAFEQHLELCPICHEMVAAQRAVWSALDELTPLPVSADFDASLYQRIAEEQPSASWWRLLRPERLWRPAVPVAAACAVLMVAFLLKAPAPSATSEEQPQPRLQIEQVERALDDMDMLKQAGVELAPEKSAPREQI
jgi:hypothetical protein